MYVTMILTLPFFLLLFDCARRTSLRQPVGCCWDQGGGGKSIFPGERVSVCLSVCLVVASQPKTPKRRRAAQQIRGRGSLWQGRVSQPAVGLPCSGHLQRPDRGRGATQSDIKWMTRGVGARSAMCCPKREFRACFSFQVPCFHCPQGAGVHT